MTNPLRARVGLAFIIESIPTLLAAAAVTFSGYHGAFVGIVVFIAYAALVTAALLVKALWTPMRGLTRNLVIVQAIALSITGIIAAIVASPNLTNLVIILSIWLAISGAIELYLGYRETDRGVTRDYLFLGALSAILAVIIAVIRMNDVYVVGLFGAYLAVRGVYEIIGGLSMRTTNSSSKTPKKTADK